MKFFCYNAHHPSINHRQWLPYLDHENLCNKGLAGRGGGRVDQVHAVSISQPRTMALPYLEHENLCYKGLAGRGGGGVDQVPSINQPRAMASLTLIMRISATRVLPAEVGAE